MLTCALKACPQKATDGSEWCYYHSKMEKGLTQPVDSYSTPTEIDTLFRGRTRHDGRRLDAWTK